MAAFKRHCAFGFWKGRLVLGHTTATLKSSRRNEAPDGMGQFGRITSLADLPSSRELTRLVRKAVRVNEQAASTPRSPTRARRSAPRPVAVPPELEAALRKHPDARARFDAFSPSHRREYAEWIAEAKREETRKRRIETAIAWLVQGKRRNWKYLQQQRVSALH